MQRRLEVIIDVDIHEREEVLNRILSKLNSVGRHTSASAVCHFPPTLWHSKFLRQHNPCNASRTGRALNSGRFMTVSLYPVLQCRMSTLKSGSLKVSHIGDARWITLIYDQ